jgi:hypothetical protein
MVDKPNIAASPVAEPVGLTVGTFCSYLASSAWDQCSLLTWPPDVFALAAALLTKSGAYSHAVSGWERDCAIDVWSSKLKTIGEEWQRKPSDPPQAVVDWHQILIDHRDTSVFDICREDILCCALLELCAAADEACAGVGCTVQSSQSPDFLLDASTRLFETARTLRVSTLCKSVHYSTVRVLPKLHTPQSGITIRSLSHNLALCPAGDVKAKWSECLSGKRHCLNLLLAPWPLTVAPAHFVSVDPTRAELPEMATGFGFFEYSHPVDQPRSGFGQLRPAKENVQVLERLNGLLENSKKLVSTIDGVIFPELALNTDQYASISEALMQQGIFLIAGVREPPNESGKAAQNYVRFDVKFANRTVSHSQHKHHRWRLDRRQIVQYGLGSCLDVTQKWWEHISISERELYFVVLDNWLTICPLICEDLARQDPIGELVRAVGPNLVIALLMDGPQLPSRWPARYATVLADDPGSSVLTLTSLGMAELSRPPNVTGVSRAVALWKDAKTGEAVSIELPKNMEGIILSLSRTFVQEYAADGRDDGGTTGYPTLSGIHFVSSN